MNITTSQALSAALLRILRALVRILLRHGVSYEAFADLAKWLYVDMAMDKEEFGVAGRKPSLSRAAVITGLSRKEVVRVRQLPRPDDHASAEKLNRAARVIAAWLRQSEFLDDKGQPAVLPIDGSGATFTELVRRYSGDIPVRPILDELTRVGAVEELEDGRVRLVIHAYIPQKSEPEQLRIFGTDVSYLIGTIDHNLRPDTSEPRFQRKVMFDNLPNEVLPEFRELSAKQAQSLLEMWAHWLARHDRDVNPSVEGTGRNRAGIGIYYFEEPSKEGV